MVASGNDQAHVPFLDLPFELVEAAFNTVRKPAEAMEQVARDDDRPWLELVEKVFETLCDVRLLAQWERNGRGPIPPEMHIREDERPLFGQIDGAIPVDTLLEHGREFAGRPMSVSVALERYEVADAATASVSVSVACALAVV